MERGRFGGSLLVVIGKSTCPRCRQFAVFFRGFRTKDRALVLNV